MKRKETQPTLTKRIEQLREAIRRKYRAFKLGNDYTEQILEKQYKPILTELRKQVRKIEPKEELKSEPMEYEDSMESFKPELNSTPKVPRFVEDSEVYESPSVSRILQSPGTIHETSQFVYEKFKAPVTQKYMLKFFKHEAGVKNKIDNIYGPRVEKDTFVVGNQPLSFDDEGNIHINNITYKGTEGLYELIFKRQPDEDLYTQDDLNAYKDILIKTNAHKKGYLPNSHINRPSNSLKYKTIISELFPKVLYGKGLKDLGSRDITYWDEPNELCNRLRLIVASTEAGNNNHRNEILNIIEELKEAKIISGCGNSRYKSLVN